MAKKHETFSIGDTARITGVSQKQLRNWERSRLHPAATRVVCGERAYRHFSEKQVEQIKAIKGCWMKASPFPTPAEWPKIKVARRTLKMIDSSVDR
jgi:predicted transcriptional regulator